MPSLQNSNQGNIPSHQGSIPSYQNINQGSTPPFTNQGFNFQNPNTNQGSIPQLQNTISNANTIFGANLNTNLIPNQNESHSYSNQGIVSQNVN